MNLVENQQQATLYETNNNTKTHEPSSNARSAFTLVLTLLAIILLIGLHCEMFFEMRSLHKNQLEFVRWFEQVNLTASRLKENVTLFEGKAQKYIPDEFEGLSSAINSLYGQAVKTSQTDPSEEKNDLLQSMRLIEESHQDWRVGLGLVDANLKEYVRTQRIQVFQKVGNTTAFKPNKIRGPWNLTRLNFQTPYMDTVERKQSKKWIENETARLEKDYEIHRTFTELPMCLISSTRNNAKDYRYEYHLQSILNQNYSNYQIVIIDEGSTDGTPQIVRKFMRSRHKLKSQYAFIQGKPQQSRMQLLYSAIIHHCKPEAIAVLLSGSDELLGTKTLKLLNIRYQQKGNVSVIYSNYFKVNPKQEFYQPVKAEAYQSVQANYRALPPLYGPFVTFLVSHFRNIKQLHLRYPNGSWIEGDQALMIPLLQMSCGKSQHLDEYLYLIYQGNDQHPEQPKGRDNHLKQYLETLQPYQCFKEDSAQKVTT